MSDTTPPALLITGFTQFGGDGNPAIDADILLDFSEAVDLANSGSVTVRRSDTHALVETLSVASGAVQTGGSSVTVNPVQDLAYATDYYLTVEPGTIADDAGNPWTPVPGTLAFRTAANADAPALQSLSFSQSGPGGTAAPSADVTLFFSEDVFLSNSATFTLRRSDDDQAVETLSVADGTVQVSGSSVTVNPAQDLAYATGYYLDIDPAAIRDGDGNTLSGAAAGGSDFSFRTAAAAAAPLLLGASFDALAADGAAARDTDIVLGFDEDVHLGNSGSITLRRSDTKEVVETFSIAGGTAAGVSTSGSAVTINPTHDLDYATGYYLTVDPGAIKDAQGDGYAAADNTTLAFRTSNDGTPPSLAQVRFTAHGADGKVAPASDIVLKFNEGVRFDPAGTVTLHRADTGAVVDTLGITGGAVQVGGSSITINPTHDLDYATRYYLTVEPGIVRDDAGNGYTEVANDPNLIFTTSAAPSTGGGGGPAPSTSQLIDGVTVSFGSQTLADGTVVPTTSVPVVAGSRADTDSTSAKADIPLATAHDGTPLLSAQVPAGYGLQAIGTAGSGRDGLVAAIESRTASAPADRAALTDGGSGYLDALPQTTNLTVRTIVPGVGPGQVAAPGEPLVITGTSLAQDGTQQQAVVLDAGQLPSGSTVAVRDVDFAAVVGSVTVREGSGGAADADPLQIFGDGAAQTLAGGSAADILSGGGGTDALRGDAGSDLAYGNQGDDLIYGNQGRDRLYGGQGDDRAFGGQDDDRIWGNQGADQLFGNQGGDLVYGNQGMDTLYGGQGIDTIFGGQDGDLAYGNLGADTIYGNQGADTLYGGQGSDTLYGGRGDDVLLGGVGDDVLVGGRGADRYVFAANSGHDLVVGFSWAEGDRLVLGGQTYAVGAAKNGDALLTLSGGGTIELSGIQADQFDKGAIATT